MWLLTPSEKMEMVQYDNLSLAYGVRCWDDQLRFLNTAYTFFTDQPVSRDCPRHMHGLFVLDDNCLAVVGTREDSLARGIKDDYDGTTYGNNVTSDTRSARSHLKKLLGPQFVTTFWQNDHFAPLPPFPQAKRTTKGVSLAPMCQRTH
jgi:hypothetical protein